MDPAVALEARRLLDRYQREVVERFDLCPWAAPARRRGEVRIEVVDVEDALAGIERIADDASVSLGMVVFAASTLSTMALRRLRDQAVAARRDVAIADFHPEAVADTGAAARLVPFLRRSPDPMLQVVPHRVLASVKRSPPRPGLTVQAAMLSGVIGATKIDVSAQVAESNRDTVLRVGVAAVGEILDDICRDRDAAYARCRR